jgi:molybdopterin-containing oxidoreductase family iron-sulfur binding subunit
LAKSDWIGIEELVGGAPPGAEPVGPADLGLTGAALGEVDRRAFLKLVGLSLAAGALSGCRPPRQKIIPAVKQPPEYTPGVARWYATTCHGCPAACGALVKVMDGRPIKFEGNPDHGLSRGGLCAVGQAAVIGLYDAHRQKQPMARGQAVSWEQVDHEIIAALAEAKRQGRKIVLLTGTLVSPASRSVVAKFRAAHPDAEHVVYDAVPYDALRDACRDAYGQPVLPTYRFDQAETVLSFGADFLGTWLSPVEFTWQYATARTSAAGGKPFCHFQFESCLSLTGTNAGVRAAIAPSEQAASVAWLLAHVAAQVGGQMPLARAAAALPRPSLSRELEAQLTRAAGALLAARGRSLVVAGGNDPSVQLGVLALNELLGNHERTFSTARPSHQRQGRAADLDRLVGEMQRGEVGALLVYGCNPAYSYRDAAAFTAALAQVPCTISLATAPDETAARAAYRCPAHHPLESWGDAEPQAGRLSLFQPTIRPLYATRAFEESLLAWSGQPRSYYAYLKEEWKTRLFPRQAAIPRFNDFWKRALQRGYVELPASGQDRNGEWVSWRVDASEVTHSLTRPAGRTLGAGQPAPALELELFEPVALRDGVPAGNAWLQELPDPVTKITWDSWVAVAPVLARQAKIQEGQWLEIEVGGRRLRAAAHLQPGQHSRTLSLPLGYGRTHAGPVGSGIGVDAYPLLAAAGSPAPVVLRILPLSSAPANRFACTQPEGSMDDRSLVREIPLNSVSAGHEVSSSNDAEREHEADLWRVHEKAEYRWGLVIDLEKCTGCSACVTACDLENNVPVVGREEVGRQREMHWLRVDRYYTGDPEAPGVRYQPVMCQQCENASCESVCPVLATVHDDQGLNVQVYNRCVGTRYCANACPYKTRRFNFFENTRNDPTQNLALNPDVTVRSRGVMEKCTFCIQRIQAARIRARREDRLVRDGEVRTACEQSCPAGALVFGNLADPDSRVARLARSPRSYRLLEETNRRPAVRYLARVRSGPEEGSAGD